MKNSTVTRKLSSWAVPTAEDDATWEQMTREEQLAQYRAHFQHPDCTTPTDVTVDQIVDEVRARRKTVKTEDGGDL